MNSLLLVMAGGAAGSGARYVTGRATLAAFGAGYPWGTLIVNLVGGLLMGLVIGMLARMSAGEHWRLLLAVGALGGFTTFSAFSLEIVLMLQRGEIALATGYALASVIGSCAALVAGLALTRIAA